MKKLKTFLVILILSSLVKAQVFPQKNWEKATPQSQGIDSVKLEEAMNYLNNICGYQGTSQSLVIRHGYIIWQGEDIDNFHNVWINNIIFSKNYGNRKIRIWSYLINGQVKMVDEEISKIAIRIRLIVKRKEH